MPALEVIPYLEEASLHCTLPGSAQIQRLRGPIALAPQLSNNFLCGSGILPKHGGATEQDGYVDVVDESAGEGEWLAGGKYEDCSSVAI
jgi:hypothetical protein